MKAEAERTHSAVFEVAEQLPWVPGVYRCNCGRANTCFSYWDGMRWGYTGHTIEWAYEHRHHATCAVITDWQGLAAPDAPEPPLYISETWRQSTARVPELEAYRAQPVEPHTATVCALLDTPPGYQLLHVLHTPGGTVNIFRRVAS